MFTEQVVLFFNLAVAVIALQAFMINENQQLPQNAPYSADDTMREALHSSETGQLRNVGVDLTGSAEPWAFSPFENSTGALEWKKSTGKLGPLQRTGLIKPPGQKLNYMFEENYIGKTMLNGSADGVTKIARDIILANLWTLKKMHVPNDVKVAMWKVIKGNRSSKYLSHQEVKRLDSLIYTLPQNDLFDLNMSNWDIVRQLGNTKGFTRRQLGVLSNSLKRAWKNDNILQSVQVINQIKGLICGFPVHQLAMIPTKTFLAINSSVFLYITGCTPHQMDTLLAIAMRQDAYGPIAAWSDQQLRNIGLLIVNLSTEQLHRIRPEAMEGLLMEVISHMTAAQLKSLLRKQVKALKGDVLAMYRERARDTNVNSSVRLLPTRLLAVVVSCFILFRK